MKTHSRFIAGLAIVLVMTPSVFAADNGTIGALFTCDSNGTNCKLNQPATVTAVSQDGVASTILTENNVKNAINQNVANYVAGSVSSTALDDMMNRWGANHQCPTGQALTFQNGAFGCIAVGVPNPVPTACNMDTTPAAPVSLVPTDIASTSFKIRWEPSSCANSYQYRINGGSWASTTANEYTISGLSAGTSYTIDVRAVSAYTSSKVSSVVSTSAVTLCGSNTMWNGSTCVPNIQLLSCAGSVPSDGSVAMTPIKYASVYNGTGYNPTSLSWSTVASTDGVGNAACRYAAPQQASCA